MKSECPLDGKCNYKNIVYQATVTPDKDGWAEQTYIGLTSTKFKARLANHKATFKNKQLEKNCKLAQAIWKLKDRNINYSIKWKIVTRASTYSPITNVRNLCVNEKYYILYHPNMCTINSRSELKANCRHKSSLLLDKGSINHGLVTIIVYDFDYV